MDNFIYTGRRNALNRFIRDDADGSDLDVVKEVVTEVLDKGVEDDLPLNQDDIIQGLKDNLSDAVSLILTPAEPKDDRETAEYELDEMEEAVVDFAEEIVEEVLDDVVQAIGKLYGEEELKESIKPFLPRFSPDSIAEGLLKYIHQNQENRIKEVLSLLHPSIQKQVRDEFAKANPIS